MLLLNFAIGAVVAANFLTPINTRYFGILPSLIKSEILGQAPSNINYLCASLCHPQKPSGYNPSLEPEADIRG